MARKGITYDAVANAARSIKARGQEPTIAAIRIECGDEGSYTTISTHLAKWRAEEMDKVETKTLPPEVENKMMEALMTVWNVATKSAAEDLAAIRQEYADETKKLRAELETAKREIEVLEENLEKSEELQEEWRRTTKEIQKTLTETSGELSATKSLYQMLLGQVKPQADQDKQASGTKQERQKG